MCNLRLGLFYVIVCLSIYLSIYESVYLYVTFAAVLFYWHCVSFISWRLCLFALTFHQLTIAAFGLLAFALRRFYSNFLLPVVRQDIQENKRLNYHLYFALRKAVYKPAAFYKGIILPLCQVIWHSVMRICHPLLLVLFELLLESEDEWESRLCSDKWLEQHHFGEKDSTSQGLNLDQHFDCAIASSQSLY